MNNHRDEIEIDLLEIFQVIRKRFLVILLTALIFAGGAGVYSFFVAEPVYESTSKLYILTQSTSITSLADLQVGSSLALDYLELMKSRPIVEEVIENLSLEMKYDDMLEIINVTNPADTRFLNISVQGNDPGETTAIANEFSQVAIKHIPEIMKTDEPSVVEVATLPDEPIKPEKAKNIAIAFLLGAFLAAMVVIVLDVLNDRLKTQEDIERYLELNTLAAVPYSSSKTGSRRDKGSRRSKKKKA